MTVFIAALIGMIPAAGAFAIDVNVTGLDGTPVSGFRWTLEEDNTHTVTPGAVGETNTLSMAFHASHAPTLASGEVAGSTFNLEAAIAAAGLDFASLPSDRFFINVLPNADYELGGMAFDRTAVSVDIQLGPRTVPTAQISVLAFEDNAPINGIPDLPQEQPLAGFDVLVFDAAGIYGAAGGQVIQDAFGNPLGSTYNPDGSLAAAGTGYIKTDSNGRALIKNLAPGKYGIQIVPPVGSDWIQTTTIEGAHTSDAWVMANEPSYFMEFGPPGHHVFLGFVSPSKVNTSTANTDVLTGGATITGRIVNLHTSRPPRSAFYAGEPVPGCIVGLNENIVGGGRGLYVTECNDDSTFSIPDVPPGSYQMVVWDEALFKIIALLTVNVPENANEVALMDVPVFDWFARLYNTVFYDQNQNGFMDDGEMGVLEQNINIRWRNGAIYNGMPTDLNGESPMDEVFPFFHWLVAEVDFARFKATGVTWVVDDGGPVDPDQGWAFPSDDRATPQVQADGSYHVTTTEPYLTLAFQAFLGQTSFINWGKAPYDIANDENGGISGIVYYAATRAEEKPQFAAPELWETGIPRVQMSLYRASAADPKVIDDMVDGVAGITYADVDNYPLGNFPGPEDVDYNGNLMRDMGDAISVVWSDSFDDSQPTGCIGPDGAVGNTYNFNGVAFDCFDGMRVFNQVRPGVFDGGYAFGTDETTGLPLASGNYIVKADTPPGYVLLKEEDKNVNFGMSYTPQLLPAECVGAPHTVPTYMSANSDGEVALPGVNPADLVETNPVLRAAPRPLCDLKAVPLVAGTNAAADFYMFTPAPKAARAVGFVLNDLANEWDPNSPQFGEKLAPPWMPITFRDWTGRVIAKTYTDEYGKYNALLPSTFTANLPMPSGMGAQMLTVCVNDASPVSNPAYNGTDPTVPALITDPYFNRQYSQFCYTLQYQTGTTTYLDTPALPIAAFAAKHIFPVDCEADNGVPRVYSVVSNTHAGPYVPDAGGTLTIVSMGNVDVPNPAYDGTLNPDGTLHTTRTITRNYGFGDVAGIVRIGNTDYAAKTWSNGVIEVDVPAGAAGGQLTIVKADGVSSNSAVTVTVGGYADTQIHTVAAPNSFYAAQAQFSTIQAGIDAAAPGDLVLVAPGLYEELAIMYKPILLQGAGEGTYINAVKIPNNKLVNWRAKMVSLMNQFDLLPGQPGDVNVDPTGNEPGLFATEEGAGLTVVGLRPRWTRVRIPGTNPPQFERIDVRPASFFNATTNARIDGIQFSGAQQGGGVFVNGYTDALQISNLRLIGNQGSFGGGIRVGDPMLDWDGSVNEDGTYDGAWNQNLVITHNEVLMNGSGNGSGGGVAMYGGAAGYQVVSNRICGNMSQGNAGGIGHDGESPNGLIANNEITFNQSFQQAGPVHGGGIGILGKAPLPGETTHGTGSVTINGNLIQGNNAGAGDGAGILLSMVDGMNLVGGSWGQGGPTAAKLMARTNKITITNNIIVNNVTGLAGGGIAAQDALNVDVINNTVANNDSTATASGAFTAGTPGLSVPQPAGISARAHTAQMTSIIPTAINIGTDIPAFAGLNLENNVVYRNRSYNFMQIPGTTGTGITQNILVPQTGDRFDDLGVVGVAGDLVANHSVLTAGAPELALGVGNVAAAPDASGASPLFIQEVVNNDRRQSVAIPEIMSTIQVAVAFDEGGNFIDVIYGPLSLDLDGLNGRDSNYHLQTIANPAVDAGLLTVAPATDIDGDTRPIGAGADVGADEAL